MPVPSLLTVPEQVYCCLDFSDSTGEHLRGETDVTLALLKHKQDTMFLNQQYFHHISLRGHGKRTKFSVVLGSLKGKAATRKLLQLFDI